MRFSFLFLIGSSVVVCSMPLDVSSLSSAMLRHLRPDESLRRNLQAASNSSVCNADGSVNFTEEDDTSFILFGGGGAMDFETSCVCDEDDNFDEVNAAIAALDTSDLTAFVQDFNILWGSLYSNLEYFCVNGCETCLETGTCGIWETSSSVRSTFEEGNFTLDDILSLDLSSGLPMFSSNATDCVTYTQNLDGTMCYGIFRQDLEDSECSIAYNGVPCTSCLIYYIDSNKTMGCLQADCTNIQSEAAIDSCFDSGFVGPFEFLHFVQSNFLVSNNFDVGLCVGSAVPTPTNTSVAPTEAPEDPTDTPVAPMNAPSSPTNAPVTQTEAPVTPTSIPAAPTDVPTEAPVYGVPTSFPTDDPTMVGPNGSVAADQSAPVSSASSTVVSIGAVIGSVVGGMLLMAVIGFVIYMHRKTKDDTELKKNASIFREFPESSGGTNTSHDAHNSSSNNTCVVPSVTAAPFTAIHRVPNANNRDDVILLSPGTPVGHPLTYKGQCQSFAKAGAHGEPPSVRVPDPPDAAYERSDSIPFAVAVAVTPSVPSSLLDL